jgi:hypothetical protein
MRSKILTAGLFLCAGWLATGAFATDFPTYDSLNEGPLRRPEWQGRDFVFYKYAEPTPRERVEFEAQKLIEPTWNDPDFYDLEGFGEWDWQLHTSLARYDDIRDHFASGGHRDTYHAVKLYYRHWFDEEMKTIPAARRDKTTMLTFPAQFNFACYDAAWGAGMVGQEIGINSVGFQSKLAYLRGAARQNQIPFYVQVSPWYIDYGIWARGEDREPSGFTQYYKGLPETEVPPADLPLPKELGVGGRAGWWNGGHCASFLARCWTMSWLSGASVVMPEAFQHNFFAYDPEFSSQKGTGNGYVPNDPKQRATLSPLGERAQTFLQLTRDHTDRGIPYAPFAILVDQYAGFNGSMCAGISSFEGKGDLVCPPRPWGVLQPTLGDREMYLFFDTIWPDSMYLQLLIGRNQDGIVNQDRRMVASLYGDTFDVLLSNVSEDVLQAYPVVICIGDQEFLPATTDKLTRYLLGGGRVYLTYAQAEQLGPTMDTLRAAGRVELYGLDQEHRPAQVEWKRWLQPFLPVSVADEAEIQRREEGLKLRPYEVRFKQEVERIMAELAPEFLPVKVEGDIQYLINRTPHGWVVGLINNAGIEKGVHTPVQVDPSEARSVTVTLRDGTLTRADEWYTEKTLAIQKNRVSVTVPSGDVRILNLEVK